MYDPVKVLANLNKLCPGMWRDVDQVRNLRGKNGMPDWSPHIFLPMNGWLWLLKQKGGKCTDMQDICALQLMATIGSWRPAQDIVKFDPDVLTALLETPLDGAIPTDVLLRLPSWCVYIDAPFEFDNFSYDGFYVMPQVSNNHDSGNELYFYFANEHDSMSFPLWLLPNSTIEEAINVMLDYARNVNEETRRNINKHDYTGLIGAIKKLLPLVIYICAYGFSDKERGLNYNKAQYPAAKKTKTGWRIFPPDKPKIHILGREFGEQIRVGRKGMAGSHASKKPHIRRAHWHGYWLGPRKESTNRIYQPKWLPPIPVAMADDFEANV